MNRKSFMIGTITGSSICMVIIAVIIMVERIHNKQYDRRDDESVEEHINRLRKKN